MWTVSLAAHDVGRWRIGAVRVKLPAVSEDHALSLAVAIAHRAAGVPPWRPLERASLAHVSAEPVEREVGEMASGQLEPARPA
jgi:hypothetical protein